MINFLHAERRKCAFEGKIQHLKMHTFTKILISSVLFRIDRTDSEFDFRVITDLLAPKVPITKAKRVTS